MAERRTSRPAPTVSRSKGARRQNLFRRQFSAFAGGALIALALFWFVWLLLRQVSQTMNPGVFPLTGSSVQHASSTPSISPTAGDPLAEARITLTSPAAGQVPTITQQQALFLAGQVDPAASANAGSVTEQYTLFSYTSADTAQESFHDVPVWLVHYSDIAEPHPDASADPHATTESHDFYIFLNAHSGQELLAIWL